MPNWLWDITGVIPWTMLAGSIGLSVWGLVRRSSQLLVWAALPSLIFSFMAGFSIGWITLLLPCLQIAAWHTGPEGWQRWTIRRRGPGN